MLFTSPTQIAALLLMLIVGWLFGFASHPGGKKWRARYEQERRAHAACRQEADARRQDAEARIAALERENQDLAANLDHARTGGIRASGPAVAASAARPMVAATATGDDLQALRGVDVALAGRLHAEGVTRFRDLADLSDQDEIALERRLELPAGYIQAEQLREQARLLADGKAGEHAGRFS